MPALPLVAPVPLVTAELPLLPLPAPGAVPSVLVPVVPVPLLAPPAPVAPAVLVPAAVPDSVPPAPTAELLEVPAPGVAEPVPSGFFPSHALARAAKITTAGSNFADIEMLFIMFPFRINKGSTVRLVNWLYRTYASAARQISCQQMRHMQRAALQRAALDMRVTIFISRRCNYVKLTESNVLLT